MLDGIFRYKLNIRIPIVFFIFTFAGIYFDYFHYLIYPLDDGISGVGLGMEINFDMFVNAIQSVFNGVIEYDYQETINNLKGEYDETSY